MGGTGRIGGRGLPNLVRQVEFKFALTWKLGFLRTLLEFKCQLSFS